MHQFVATALAAFLLLAGAASAQAQQWGTLKGRFVFDGPAPTLPKIQVTKDIEVCGKYDLGDESLVVGPEGGLANVVVYLRTKPSAVHPDAGRTDKPVLDNAQCRFEPHVVPVQVGQPLVIKNSDDVGHNAKIDSFTNNPVNVLIPANGAVEQTFAAPETLPARVSCNIHPWMSAWLVIRPDPYMAVSSADGSFEIANLPAGDEELEFQVWHEKSGYIQQVTAADGQREWMRGRFLMQLAPGVNDLGVLKVSPSAFEK
jgi:plastocyanin